MAAETGIDRLIGDFYQAHTEKNEEAEKAAVEKIQELIDGGKADSSDFIQYFNDMYSGRSGFNTKMNISDYPKESIIRELFQNALGCRYSGDDIKIVVDFQNDGIINLSYNEAGFSMEDILFYLGFGMNSGDNGREGRFGIGAKSVFLNVEFLSVKSRNFSFKIANNAGNLHIEALDFLSDPFNGTKITIKVDTSEYERILENFLTLTDKKGDYINMVELCFAFNRKKVLNPDESAEESDARTVSIAVAKGGKVSDIYRIMLHKKDGEANPKIRFYHNNKSLVDFLFYEKQGFVYLVPFAVANAKRDSVVKVLLDKYNYFSTYELTGCIGNENDKFIDEKLSAFFVSVPNSCITYSRTGIRYDREEAVASALERDIPDILREYSKYFVLDLKQVSESAYYCLRPTSYAFEFFSSFMKTSRYAEKVRDIFVSGISLHFPDEEEPVPYDEIKKNGFKSVTCGVPKKYREDGTAECQYIDAQLEKLKAGLSDIPDKALYAGYEWENEDGSEKGREYCYEITRNGAAYKIYSGRSGSDYELYIGFSSVIGRYLGALLENDCVTDEEALEKIFALFDEAAGEDYTLSMKYYRIHFDRGSENYSFEISKISVNNLKNAMDAVEKRAKRFGSYQNYLEVVAMLVNSFTQGKDTMSFLRTIKQQGGNISLALDFNKKFRFSVYGKQFMIPSSITNADLLEILADPSQLFESGVLKGRSFDFPYVKSRYTFDLDTVSNLLINYASRSETADVMNGFAMCNMKYDGVAFLDENDKVLCVKHFGEPISEDERSSAVKYVILRDDLNKPESSTMMEYVIAGKDRNILNRYFNRTKNPHRILPDQIPLKCRRAPIFDSDEFAYVLDLYNSIKEQSGVENYKNYFAKDINGRLYGYGTCCTFCGENGHNVNAYDLVDFSIDVMVDGSEKRFKFALYLCRNHVADSDGWLIKELTIGGMDPFSWLEELPRAKCIPPEFFFCTLKYAPHLVYDITPDSSCLGSDVVAAETQTLEFRLTPLMAAKWVSDNLQG